MRKLYTSHVPLSALQKGALAVGSAVGALLSPQRADLVAALGETTGVGALERTRRKMLASKEGRSVMNHRPRIGEPTLRGLADLPENTF